MESIARTYNDMPETDDIKGGAAKRLLTLDLQERFDGRYVQKDGQYKTIVSIVIGFVSLALTVMAGAIVKWALHI